MRLFTLSVLFFILAFNARSQVVNNPFEIQTRLDSVYNAENNAESSNINVFDVYRPNETTLPVRPTNVDSLELEEESDLVPAVGEDIVEEVHDAPGGENPFDVSHIPIRKSKLKTEADAFKAPAKQARDKSSTSSNAFLFWLNLLTALIIAIVINTNRGAIQKISNSITNENVLKLIHREAKKGVVGVYLLLYFSFFINAAIFIYLFLFHFYKIHGWMSFQWTFLALVAIYLARHVFLRVIGQVFPFKKESQLFSFTIQTFNLFIGIILIPFNLIIAFGPENTALPLIYIALGLIGILVLLRTFRGFLIASTYIQSNLFHFLLYLCTFEILPILVLIKIVGNYEIA